MYRIVGSLVEIARLAGVEFEFGTAVEKILVDGYEAKGVVLDDGRCLNADFVVANADLPYVYQELLPQDRVSRAMARKRFSCSTISFFWGIDKPLKSLPPHTLFLVDDYRQNFESIIEDLTLPENPSLYVHAPARLDPTMAPTGEDTLIGITPVGHLDDEGEQDWKAIRHLLARVRILELAYPRPWFLRGWRPRGCSKKQPYLCSGYNGQVLFSSLTYRL